MTDIFKWFLCLLKNLQSLGENSWFQLIAGVASVVGLFITIWTFVRAGKVESAIRNLQLETNNKLFYPKRIQEALSFFEGISQSVEESQSSPSIRVSKIDGIRQLERHTVLLRKSVEQSQAYPWFKDQTAREKKKSINNMKKILDEIELVAQKDVLTTSELHNFSKQIAELVVIIGRETKNE